MKHALEISHQKDCPENPQGFYYLIVIDGKKYAGDTPEDIGRIIIENVIDKK